MPYFDPDNLTDAEATLDDYLAIASDIVMALAPAPSPLPADYPARAARAERLLLGWLRATRGGTLTAKGGIPGATGSKSFSSLPVVQGLVRSAMGEHYVGTAGANTAYVETWR